MSRRNRKHRQRQHTESVVQEASVVDNDEAVGAAADDAEQTSEEPTQSVEQEQPPQHTGDVEEDAEKAHGGTEAVEESTDDQLSPDALREAYSLPDDWTKEDILRWRDSDYRHEKLSDGVFVYDPTRARRPLNDWRTSELLAMIKGQIKGIPNHQLSRAIDTYRQRETVDRAWTDEQVVEYFRHGVTPPQTESGVWVHDRTRATRKVQDWSDAELDAWAKGEIRAVGSATDVRLAEELKKRRGMDDLDGTVSDIRERYAQQPQNQSKPDQGALTDMNVVHIDNTLERYATAVSLGQPVSELDGQRAQRMLDNLFHYVLRLEGRALAAGLDRIKAFIHAHRDGVFSPDAAYRFVNLLKGDKKNQFRHINLIELFLVVTHKNKAMRQQVDIDQMLAPFPPEQAELLKHYFSRG